MSNDSRAINAISFSDGYGNRRPSWETAKKLAGEDSRIATMPDMVLARLNNPPDTDSKIDNSGRAFRNKTPEWDQYHTTNSAEYFGETKAGNDVVIISHGRGPLASISGIEKSLSRSTGNDLGAKITKEQFYDLEAGKYGDVDVIDYNQYIKDHGKHSFLGGMEVNDGGFRLLSQSEALENPLLKARLGSRAEEIINMHSKVSREILEGARANPRDNFGRISHLEDPYVFENAENINNQYRYKKPGTDPFANLLSIDRLTGMRGNDETGDYVASGISSQSPFLHARFVAIKDGEAIKSIYPVDDLQGLVASRWQEAMVTETKPRKLDFMALTELRDGTLFTQIPKSNETPDTNIPEYRVDQSQKIGETVEIKTTDSNSLPLLMFDIKEVREKAPAGANAYRIVGDPYTVPSEDNQGMTGFTVQFYKVKVDTSKKLLQGSDLLNKNNFDLLEQFITDRQAA